MKALTPEEREIGKKNFQTAAAGGKNLQGGDGDFTRREFLLGSVAAVGVGGAGLGAFYFGYSKPKNALPIGIIGTGDEGGVLIGALNPDYVDVKAICDIRPYNIHRAFHGDQSSERVLKVRPGLITKYDLKSEDNAKKKIKVYPDYKELIKDPNIKAVIIALPLHLHHSVAIEAMAEGKHVLTEKLMAHSVGKCKSMGRVAAQKKLHLATGHQRHYSVLYDNAVNIIKNGLIGDLHHIRAQWHRQTDTWKAKMPDQAIADKLAEMEAALNAATTAADIEYWQKERTKYLIGKDFGIEAKGYESGTVPGKTPYSYEPLEELIRWRLWNRTGGGLMAELGSHQLDASGIFCTALRTDDKKARPLSVVAVGGRHLYTNDRETDDHVYCNYEFEGPGYDPKDEDLKHKKIVVTYSSINGNGFGGYGEVVMGTKGTIVLENETDYQLYSVGGPTMFVDVVKDEKADKGVALVDTTASAPPAAAVGAAALDAEPVSKGYREEIEHWAWCIENNPNCSDKDPKVNPKCRPEVAMADAIIALTTNIAIRKKERIEFNPLWFEINDDATPENEPPTVKVS